ncbi:MAG TPA: hypothetical protein VK138_03620, partial [Acidiferrobacterales bacterium]|nr:hypothetical protein [Acidiferrobacterales bacterium]
DPEVVQMVDQGVDPRDPHWFMAPDEAHFVGVQGDFGFGGAQGPIGSFISSIPGGNFAGLVVDGLDVPPSGLGYVIWAGDVAIGVPLAYAAQLNQTPIVVVDLAVYHSRRDNN